MPHRGEDYKWYCDVCGAKLRTFCGAPCTCDSCARKSEKEAFDSLFEY